MGKSIFLLFSHRLNLLHRCFTLLQRPRREELNNDGDDEDDNEGRIDCFLAKSMLTHSITRDERPAYGEERNPVRDMRVTKREEPVASRDDGAPTQDESATNRDEPVAIRDESLSCRDSHPVEKG
jgi:hypothetical protein